MHMIIPDGLWIGSAREARDGKAILQSAIAAIVDLAYEEKPAELPRSVVYFRFPLIDGDENERVHLRLAVQAVVALLRAEVPTLVACSAGMSRSPAITAAALSVYRGEPPERSLASVAESHPHDVSPALWAEVVQTLREDSH